MATIALYADKVNYMPLHIEAVTSAVKAYQSELFNVKKGLLQINQSICDLSEVVSSVQVSSQIQEEKSDSLETIQKNCEQFIENAVRIDAAVAEEIKKRKDAFYSLYNYLKPECEKNNWDRLCRACQKATDWCREHWKEIVITIGLVIGAVLAIAAVLGTGGMALVPMLTALLTTVGVGAGTATGIATVVSLIVGTIAVCSTSISTILNIMDTWGDYGDNPDFKRMQTAWNWISMASNLFYSAGNIYNSFKGISGASLREYSKHCFMDSNFRKAVVGADKMKFMVEPNQSTFWAGLGKDGEYIAKEYAAAHGRTTLELTLESQQFTRPVGEAAWQQASVSYALRTSGKVEALLSEAVGGIRSSGDIIGNTWLNFESVVLNINPFVTGINGFTRTFQLRTLLYGIFSAGESTINMTE